MKANVRCGALACLLIVGCNPPDTDLFWGDSPQPLENGAAGSPATGGVSSAGSSASAGGVAGTSIQAGGTSASAGGPVDIGTSGSANPPVDQGMAGASDGAGGKAEPPKPLEPVCGNGKLEAGEECDDAGHAGEDGCTACQVVCSDFGEGTLESEDHHCYNGYNAADFEGAQQACQERGAHLATIRSSAENKLARSLVDNSKWIGGFENVSPSAEGTGTYTWLSGEPFTYTNWASSEPDQGRYRCPGASGPGSSEACYEHCVSMTGDGTWADQPCDLYDGYVCEWEPAGSK